MLSQIASSSRRASTCRICQAHSQISRPILESPRYFTTSTTTFRIEGQQFGVQSFGRDRGPRFQGGGPPRGGPPRPGGGQSRDPTAYKGRFGKSLLTPEAFKPDPPPSALHTLRLFIQRLPEFIRSDRFRDKLDAYRLELPVQTKLVKEWKEIVENQMKHADDEKSAILAFAANGWDLQRFILSFGGDGTGFAEAVESAMTRKFVTFASTHPLVAPSLQAHLRSILEATDLTKLLFSDSNMRARSMTRHFHLHIGPTNSGKTYNALKALAKAETGAYAGPLRLLAHEVWERLNLGTVGGLDGEGKACNLLTGEERRIVDPAAGLMSCTVEMIPLGGPREGYDVVVIDEIQMLGDPQRGGAWTSAVLGVRAKEVHLCGDETTVELLETLIPILGDKITIHRYERLTPLTVAEESLNGDFKNVQKGDCVVTFSRNNIYAVKKMIESEAGKKCAVVYGALPPETRAEQAREFNDENSQSEILVASDAVGMGLNLKINRIIFESLEKYNGRSEVPLALTQIKQIAGRAGRFGMQRKTEDSADDNQIGTAENEDPVRPDEVPVPGGVVTTLHKVDLPILRQVLPMQLPPIKQATIEIPFRTLSDLSVLLPPGTSFGSVLEHVSTLAVFPPGTTPAAYDHRTPISDTLEVFRNLLSFKEIDLFTRAPVSNRDPIVSKVFPNIVKDYAEKGLVEIDSIYENTRLLQMLDLVEATLATLPPLPPIIGIGRRVLTPPVIVTSIPSLESMHKTLVLYIWLSFRLEVAFPHRTRASDLKHRVEVVLEECLQRFPGLRNLKSAERTKQGDRAVADWRKQYVAPNGTRKMPGSDRKGIKWVEEAVVQRLRNKEVWKSTGVVPYGRVLKEIDGRGPTGQVIDRDTGEIVISPPQKGDLPEIGEPKRRAFGQEYKRAREGKTSAPSGPHGFGLRKSGGEEDVEEYGGRQRSF